MVKTKILKNQKKFSLQSLIKHKVGNKKFKNTKKVKRVLVEVLMEGDLETFQDILIAHLRVCPKSQLAKMSGIGRQTLYDLISDEKEFNPRFKTLGAILGAIAA